MDCETLTGGNGRFLQLRGRGRDLHPEATEAKSEHLKVLAARCSVRLGANAMLMRCLWFVVFVMFVALHSLNLSMLFSCHFMNFGLKFRTVCLCSALQLSLPARSAPLQIGLAASLQGSTSRGAGDTSCSGLI